MQAHRGVSRAGVHMHHHRLPAAGDGGKTSGHVHRHVFVGAQHHLGVSATFLLPAGELFNQGHMVGAQVRKNVVHPEVGQTL